MKEPPGTAPFDCYIAVDWSGARGTNNRSIVVARLEGGANRVDLVSPPSPRGWSRSSVMSWLIDQASKGQRTLVGFDFSFSGPFLDEGSYFPGCELGGKSAPELWDAFRNLAEREPANQAGAIVDPGTIVRHPVLSPFFLTAKGRGGQFSRRFRATEIACRTGGYGAAESLFHLVGPSQVGLGSIAGMAELGTLACSPDVFIWPFGGLAPPFEPKLVVVEIFCRLWLLKAGMGRKKIRTIDDLNRALSAFDCVWSGDHPVDDHTTDAAVSVAALSQCAQEQALWSPLGLSADIARTEGWTFGVP
ncbi:MAG: hypothetical protein AAGF15_02940 [Pseudomonadota bacterium]